MSEAAPATCGSLAQLDYVFVVFVWRRDVGQGVQVLAPHFQLALLCDLRVQHGQALAQHLAVELAIEAGLTFLQAQPARLELLHQA